MKRKVLTVSMTLLLSNSCGELSLDGAETNAFDYPSIESTLAMKLPRGITLLTTNDIATLEGDASESSPNSPLRALKLLLNLTPTVPHYSHKAFDDLSGRIFADARELDSAMGIIEELLAEEDTSLVECLQAEASEVAYDFNAGGDSGLPNVNLKLQCKITLPESTNGSGIAFGQSEDDFYLHLHLAPEGVSPEVGAEQGTLLLAQVNKTTFEVTLTGMTLVPGATSATDVQRIYQAHSSLGLALFRAYSIGINDHSGLGCGLQLVSSDNYFLIHGNYGATDSSQCQAIETVPQDATGCYQSKTLVAAESSASCTSLHTKLEGLPDKSFDSHFKERSSLAKSKFSISSLPEDVTELTLPSGSSSDDPSSEEPPPSE